MRQVPIFLYLFVLPAIPGGQTSPKGSKNFWTVPGRDEKY